MAAIVKGHAGIYRAARTPLAPAGANLLGLRPEAMLARLARALLDPLGAAARAVEGLWLGCSFPEGMLGLNLARTALLLAGREVVPGCTLSCFGGAGLETVSAVVGRLCAGGEAGLAAGIELPSKVPYGGATLAAGLSYEMLQRDAFWPRHLAAHRVAEEAGLSRAELDAYAARRRPGRFGPQAGFALALDAAAAPPVTPDAPAYPGTPPLYSSTGGEVLFRACHAATPADGAAMLLLGRDGALPGRPLAYVRGVASAGAAPTRAPAALFEACRKALQRAEVAPGLVDLWMVDESFAGVPCGLARGLGIDLARVNPAGGTLGCGFAAGAEGCRLVGEASLALAGGAGRYAVAGAWGEGGVASALVLEVA